MFKNYIEYVKNQWIPNQIWNNYSNPIHQERFDFLVNLSCLNENNWQGRTINIVGSKLGHSVLEFKKRIKPNNVIVGMEFDESFSIAVDHVCPDCALTYFPEGEESEVYDHEITIVDNILQMIEYDDDFISLILRITSGIAIFCVPAFDKRYPGTLRCYTIEDLQKIFHQIEGISFKIFKPPKSNFFYIHTISDI